MSGRRDVWETLDQIERELIEEGVCEPLIWSDQWHEKIALGTRIAPECE